MSLPPGFLDELRSRVSLAQIVGRRVAWDPRKSNAARGDWWAPCPFHQEKSASFHVDEAKGYYYCFGCHAKGDAVSFLRETENLGFIEAVERLAADAGMAMPERDPAAAARATANQGLAEAMEAAVQFYRLQLATTRAAEARAYLDRRGLAPATRDRFEIGYAPDSRTALLEHLTGKGFARETAWPRPASIGLPKDGGSPYDRFRGRIIFPIRDGRGRPIAFGARAIAAGQEPKYLNSPDTPLFDKGRTLYNLGPARTAAAKAGTVIVTEGYMDVIALAQAGFDHAVAPLGTAITEAQLAMLWKLAPEPVIALDGDAAGMGAAQRLIDLALPHLGPGRSLRFAAHAPRPGSRRRGPRRRRGGAAAAPRRLAPHRRPPLVARDRGRRPRQPRAPRRPRRAPARASRAHRRPRAPRPLGGRGPRPPRRPLRAAAAARARSGRTRAPAPARRSPPAASRDPAPPAPRSSPAPPTTRASRPACARAPSSPPACTTRRSRWSSRRAWRTSPSPRRGTGKFAPPS